MMQQEQEEKSSASRSTCANCTTSEIQLQVCSRCKSVKYCSRKRQAAHWEEGGHKKVCDALVAQKGQADADSLASSSSSSNHENERSCNGNEDCAVCLDSMSMFPVSNLSCGHRYHSKCTQKILQLDESLQVCPLCRATILDLSIEPSEKDMMRYLKRYHEIMAKKEHAKEMGNMYNRLRTVVEKDSTVYIAYFLIALILNERGNKADAERIVRKVVKLSKDYSPARLLLGHLLCTYHIHAYHTYIHIQCVYVSTFIFHCP